MMDNTEDLAYFKFDGSSNSLSINSTVKICQ